MERYEKICLVAARDVHPFAQRYVDVGVARHANDISPLLKIAAQTQRFVEDKVLLHNAVHAGGARIDPTMAGVHYDDVFLRALGDRSIDRERHRGIAWRWGSAGQRRDILRGG